MISSHPLKCNHVVPNEKLKLDATHGLTTTSLQACFPLAIDDDEYSALYMKYLSGLISSKYLLEKDAIIANKKGKLENFIKILQTQINAPPQVPVKGVVNPEIVSNTPSYVSTLPLRTGNPRQNLEKVQRPVPGERRKPVPGERNGVTTGGNPIRKRDIKFYQNLARARGLPWKGVCKIDLVNTLKHIKL
jgi:hypothetical protein